MKRLLMLMLVAVSLLLVACGPEETPATPEKTVDTETPVEETPTEPEEPVTETPVEEPVEPTDPVDEPEEPVEVVYLNVLSEILEIDVAEAQVVNDTNINYSKNGVSELSLEFLEENGLDGFTGTDKEIADAILEWQKGNMIYASVVTDYPYVSYGMRWASIFPGLYTTEDIFAQQFDGTNYYGVCYHYALVFASIAEYYDLDVRIGIADQKPSDFLDNPFSMLSTTGMSGHEYNAFVDFITDKGYNAEDFPYEVVRLLMTETSTHYRAEVLLDGVWVAYDKYDDDISSEGDLLTYSYDTWLAGFNPDEYDSLMARLANGESLLNEGYDSAYAQFLEARIIATSSETLPGYGGALTYVGVIDDLGQNRAANVDDIMNGLALAPYFTDREDILNFFGRPGWLLYEIDDVMMVQEEIEELTGQPYYSVAEIMTWGEDDITDPLVFVEQYEGFSGVPFNINLWEEYIK